MLEAVFNHVLQSTLFAALAGLLALAMRGTPARSRYWIWLAASFKFLVPFSLLTSLGSHFPWNLPEPLASPRWLVVMEEIRRPLTTPVATGSYPPGPALPSFGVLVVSFWLCGVVFVLFTWWLRAWRLRALVRAAIPIESGREYEAIRRVENSAGLTAHTRLRSCESRMEPGVVGIVHPVLLLPSGISDCLEETQLEAIVAHELCHIRNRDNLVAACQMTIEAIFWFHPFVWWLGARMVEERERACDEEVLRAGSEPEIYAESILRVCRFYLESPRACVSGVTGADLKKRIESIMSHRAVRRLGLARKLLLTTAAVLSIVVPVAIGMMKAPELGVESRSTSATLSFDEVSIQPGQSGSHRVSVRALATGSFSTTNASLKTLVAFGYNLRDHQISGGPDWLDSERFDIVAKSSPPQQIGDVRAMMQTLLADRFKLALRRETKQLPLFEMVAGDRGPKLARVPPNGPVENANILVSRGRLLAPRITMPDLARVLSGQVGRTVEDRTGLKGAYSVRLNWTPRDSPPDLRDARSNQPPPDPNGQSLAIALKDQLGLRLEPRTGRVETVVIEHAEKALKLEPKVRPIQQRIEEP